MLSNSAETIERLARELERQRLSAKLSECQTLEDFKKVAEELKAQCEKA